MIVHHPVLKTLEKLDLTSSERLEVKKYKTSEMRRNFLPIFRIFKNHGFKDEALELLSWGVATFPKYAAARVLLAKEMFYRGMIPSTWKLLVESSFDFNENVMAQRIIFQCAILLNYPQTALRSLQDLHIKQMSDIFLDQLGHKLKTEGLWAARKYLIGSFQRTGVQLNVEDLEMYARKDEAPAIKSEPKNKACEILNQILENKKTASWQCQSLTDIFLVDDMSENKINFKNSSLSQKENEDLTKFPQQVNKTEVAQEKSSFELHYYKNLLRNLTYVQNSQSHPSHSDSSRGQSRSLREKRT